VSFEVIVAGLGGVGSAALYHLAKRGAKVLGLDPFSPPHDRGSSHGNTRVIRLAYFEAPDYVPLLKRSYALWSDLEAEASEKLYIERGLLQVGPFRGEVVSGVLESAKAHALEIESLSAKEARRRFPQFVIPDEMSAVFEKSAGYLRVEACVEAHLRLARSLGAETRTFEGLASWKEDGDGVAVTTTTGAVHHARRLVFASGAWSPRLLAEIGAPMRLIKKTMFWFDAPPDPSWPVYLFETPRGIYYGFPPLEGEGAKAAEHSDSNPIDDPDTIDRSLDQKELTGLERFFADHVPSLRGPPRAFAVCMYTLTPDWHFIIDRHPRSDRVFFCAGLSGHGFKMAPALGEVMAELALDGKTAQQIGFLSLARFAKR
jgi:sarcosine oxidase